MCGSSPKPPPAPPPPAPPAPPPPPNVLQEAEGTRRKDSSTLTAMRGRSALRIDRAAGTLGGGGGGNGLNIPN